MNKLLPVEQRAWKATIGVIQNFLGKKKANNYKEIVAEMVEAYRVMGVHMSLKIHFLAHHLTFFPENLGEYKIVFRKKITQSAQVFKINLFQAQAVTNRVRGFTKTSQESKRITKEKAMSTCSPHMSTRLHIKKVTFVMREKTQIKVLSSLSL